MGNERVRRRSVAPPARREAAKPDGDDEGQEAELAPEKHLELATATLETARDRARGRPRPAAPRLAPELELQRTAEVPLNLVVANEPETMEEARTRRLLKRLPAAERRTLRRAVAAAIADDAVDQVQTLVDAVNRVRARRNLRCADRGAETREPLDFDRGALRDAVAHGVELGIQAGVRYALRAALEAVFGEPLEPPEDGDPLGELSAPPDLGRIHPDERRLVVQLPPIPFG